MVMVSRGVCNIGVCVCKCMRACASMCMSAYAVCTHCGKTHCTRTRMAHKRGPRRPPNRAQRQPQSRPDTRPAATRYATSAHTVCWSLFCENKGGVYAPYTYIQHVTSTFDIAAPPRPGPPECMRAEGLYRRPVCAARRASGVPWRHMHVIS